MGDLMSARRVLVIEDETGARDALESLLSEEGYVVRTAGSGVGGLECYEEFHPDTVVCDFYLPDIDGLQVLRRMRADQDNVMFIMVTAGCGGEDVEQTLRTEADYFLDKPVDLSQLRALLNGSASRGTDPSVRLHQRLNGEKEHYA